jgi:hypothetical protein
MNTKTNTENETCPAEREARNMFIRTTTAGQTKLDTNHLESRRNQTSSCEMNHAAAPTLKTDTRSMKTTIWHQQKMKTK